MTIQKNTPFLPRLIRLRDIPLYLAMDRNRFNREVRPYLTEMPIGKQGIAFDRLELDGWVEDYKSRCGRSQKHRGDLLCQSESQASTNEANRASGTLINASKDTADFLRALEQATSRKRSST
ncbi:MAG: hypothetical protein CMK46_02095 [Porticoccus sp.]|nr:hypothetical protein [Porticoccus sp.]